MNIINAVSGTGITQTADGSGLIKLQSNGVATNALAWVNFNGVTTVTIRSSYNVSSVVRNSTGVYTINFSNAMSDANYCITGTAGINASTTNSYPVNPLSYSTGSCQFDHRESGSQADSTYLNIAIFGN